MKRLLKRILPWMLVAGILLAGCTRMGPDYERPDIEVEAPETYQHAVDQDKAVNPGDKWWSVFNDEEIDRLVEKALKNNWDIRKAAARIMELKAGFVRTRAGRFPSAAISGEGTKTSLTAETQVPGDLIMTGPGRFTFGPSTTVRQEIETDSFTLSLPVTFELDLWGRLARAEEAAKAQLLQAEETQRTVRQSIIAETVSLYLQLESLERRIQIADSTVESLKRSLSLVERRYDSGLTTILALKQAQRTLAQAEAVLPSLWQELGVVQQRLSVITGEFPKTSPPRPQPEDYYRRLDPVPAGLPSDLLKRRPDVRSAEASLQALNALVGVAEASRFPTISLTGSFGYKSDDLGKIFNPENQFWNLGVNLLAPLFNAGKLKAAAREAEARYRQGVAEYARTVLTAFAEVEGALITRRAQLEKRERVLTFLEEARRTQEVAESRYERGLSGYLSVLEAQQTRFSAEESLVLVDLAILSNRVNLHRALGGGWGEETEVKEEEAQ